MRRLPVRPAALVVVAGALLLALCFQGIPSASAATIVLNNQATCEALDGDYYGPNDCRWYSDSHFIIAAGNEVQVAMNSVAGFLTNNGTLTILSNHHVWTAFEATSSGTITVKSGALLRLYQGTFDNTGTITVESGATLQVDNQSGSLTNNGTITVACGGIVTGTISSTQPQYPADCVGPTVTANQATGQVDPTNSTTINFTAVFGESVTGFTSDDVALSGTAGATTAVISQIAPNNGTTYNIAVSGMTTSGTVIASVKAGAVQDAALNPSTASTSTDNTVTYDNQQPSVTLTSTASNPTNVSPIPVTVKFSESVTGFTDIDITTSNGTVNNFAGSGDTYTFDLVPAGQGLITADIAAGKAQDGAGNGNAAATQFSRTYDSVAPTVTINQATGQTDPTGASPIRFTVVFNGPVTGFGDNPADVTFSGTAGATTAVVTQIAPNDGTTYDVAVSGMVTHGTVIASIPAGAARDAANNPSAASTSTDNTVIYTPSTQLDLVSGATTYGDTTATLTARLRVQGTNASLAGQLVVFTLAGQPVCGGTTGRACPTTNAQGVATLTGVPVTRRNAGNYANLVCASFAGGGGYLPSGPACGTLTVARRILWLKPVDRTVGLKQPNPPTTPPAGCTPTGCWLQLVNGSAFVNGDDWSALNLSQLRFSYNRNPPVTNASEYEGKTYTITAIGVVSSNYDIRYQRGTLKVVQATP